MQQFKARAGVGWGGVGCGGGLTDSKEELRGEKNEFVFLVSVP